MAGKREALSSVGGPVEARGDLAFRVPLTEAMEAQEGPRDELTHGFHSYPARMHPGLARVLLRELTLGPGSEVLDPFCGSGTVAIEAMIAGWQSLGSDLDPLALRLARVKTSRRTKKSRARFLDRLAKVAAASEKRVRGRVPVRAALSAQERDHYEVHVLKELAGLLQEIRKIRDSRDRRALEMVFSAIVVKFSRQRSDTAERAVPKRIRKGLATEFFLRKGQELERRWAELNAALPERVHEPRFVEADALSLPKTLGGEYRCDLVLTSPPYGGTYDYLYHHARRHAWLGISPKKLREGELGARRHLSRAGSDSERARAMKRWRGQVAGMLDTVATVLSPAGIAVFVVGDAEIGGQRVAADGQLEALAAAAELEVVAVASQQRPDWRGGAPRREHLVAMRPTGAS